MVDDRPGSKYTARRRSVSGHGPPDTDPGDRTSAWALTPGAGAGAGAG